MQIHFSYQHGSPHSQLEKIIDANVRKLTKLLVRFSPDLVHLHGVIEFGTAKQNPLCSLHLWLPTARLHAREQRPDILVTVRTSFSHIEEQVKKHKQILRREGEWKRKRYRVRNESKRVAAAELRVVNRQQLRDYLDQVLPQLKLFIARELRYQRMAGGTEPAQPQEEEILGEVVARSLENHERIAAEVAPFHGLLRETIQVLNGSARSNVSPEAAPPAAESTLDALGGADPAELCLALLPAHKRQLYVLHALEGFTFDEAAQVLGQIPSEVEEIFREVSREVAVAVHGTRPGAASARS